jgi:DNA-binding transcriptional regulator YdaS (Cro superfamily)
MTIDQYLCLHKMNASDFARIVPISETSLSRARKGEQNITRDVMLAIMKASDGLITADGILHPTRMNADQRRAQVEKKVNPAPTVDRPEGKAV